MEPYSRALGHSLLFAIAGLIIGCVAIGVLVSPILLGPELGWSVTEMLKAAVLGLLVSFFAMLFGFLPAVLFFVGYNVARFGSPTESGYALAQLPDWLAALRAQGLFSLAHVPMNLDYLFVHLPAPIPTFPFFKPDGLGMSIFLTSPGLVPFVLAPWRKDRRTWLLLGAAVAALIPTLLYYGGGWLQFGYRYFLDSIPFIWALCVLAAADRGRVGRVWWTFIALGVLVNAVGVYWAYNL